MAIGKRIKFFRNRKGLTQKQLGEFLGFRGKTADVRMAQYESEARIPKTDLVNQMSLILDVAPNAITVPDIDTWIGLMHTLFALEDMYGLTIGKLGGEVCLRLDRTNMTNYLSMSSMFDEWYRESVRFENGEISKEEYDNWRYTYPQMEMQRTRDAIDQLNLQRKRNRFL